VWAYCIVWWFIQDAVKVWTYVLLEKYDIFQYRTMLDPDSQKPNAKGKKSEVAESSAENDRLINASTANPGYGTGNRH
jgi:hypothetical protein